MKIYQAAYNEFRLRKEEGYKEGKPSILILLKHKEYWLECQDKWNSLTEEEKESLVVESGMKKLVKRDSVAVGKSHLWRLFKLINSPGDKDLDIRTHFEILREQVTHELPTGYSANGSMPIHPGTMDDLINTMCQVIRDIVEQTEESENDKVQDEQKGSTQV